MHVEFLVEEESCAEVLNAIVPKITGGALSFTIHIFQGKPDLLRSLQQRLLGYAKWLPEDWRVVVLVDQDHDDCAALKTRLDSVAKKVGLTPKSPTSSEYQVVNRIVMEELEAWFFGDVAALRAAFPRLSASIGQKRQYRNCDAIPGGTWEALERVLQEAGYYRSGMPKIEVARKVAAEMDPERNRSRSFQVFRRTLSGLAASA